MAEKREETPLEIVTESSTALAIPASDSLARRVDIDAAISTAKAYPRNLVLFQSASMQMATYSVEMAEKCFYVLKRKDKAGNQVLIEGPSVRLAEIIAHNWGNCRFGSRDMGEDEKYVLAEGAFHDLENNVTVTVVVKRRILTSDGRRYGSDMIAQTAAAAGAIARRNAITSGIPRPTWQKFYEAARLTARGSDADVSRRVAAAVAEFAKVGVPEEAILKTLGVRTLADVDTDRLVELRGIYTAIGEGTTTLAEAFGLSGSGIRTARELPKRKAKK